MRNPKKCSPSTKRLMGQAENGGAIKGPSTLPKQGACSQLVTSMKDVPPNNSEQTPKRRSRPILFHMNAANFDDCRHADVPEMYEPQALVLAADIGLLAHLPEESLLGLVPGRHAEAIRKNRRPEDRLRRVLARLLLGFGLSILENCDARAGMEALRHNAQGQPWLDGCIRPISLSHSGNWAVCAIGPARTRCGIGVDVEEIQPVAVEDFDLVFTGMERAAIRRAQSPASELIRRWTIKEALLKAQGTGLLADPLQIETTGDNGGVRGTLHLPLAEGYWLTVFAPHCATVALLKPSPEELLGAGQRQNDHKPGPSKAI